MRTTSRYLAGYPGPNAAVSSEWHAPARQEDRTPAGLRALEAVHNPRGPRRPAPGPH